MARIRNRKNYTREFKLEVVREVETTDQTVKEVGARYGINHDLIYQWRKKILEEGVEAFPGKGKLSKREAEVHAKEKRIRDLEMENEILKKAISIFSQDQRGNTHS